VQCALVWTRDGKIVILPNDMLDSHEPGHARDVA